MKAHHLLGSLVVLAAVNALLNVLQQSHLQSPSILVQTDGSELPESDGTAADEVTSYTQVQAEGQKHPCGIVGRMYNPDAHSKELLRTLMYRVRQGTPFAWIRVADGEMLNVHQLQHTHAHWPLLSDFYVAVGTMWMCKAYRSKWNAFAHPNYTYVDYFYLPMGDPGDEGRETQAEQGVMGWIREARRGRRYIAIIGARLLQRLPFADAFLDEANTDEVLLRFIGTQPPRTIFGVSKGTHAKRIITLAFLRNNDSSRQHTFIDVGRALNPYAGHTEFGRSLRWYCDRGRHDGAIPWFGRGVCV
jgi:hypothetical protein